LLDVVDYYCYWIYKNDYSDEGECVQTDSLQTCGEFLIKDQCIEDHKLANDNKCFFLLFENGLFFLLFLFA
jgi:hypothetical protein